MLNRGKDHARHCGIHAEDCFSSHHVGNVEKRIGFFPDVSPFRAGFKLDVFGLRYRQFSRGCRQFAVAEFAAAAAMYDEMRLGRTVFRRNIPLRGRGADQHGAPRPAYLPHQIEGTAD